jgi:hypothetical protein
MLKLLPMLKLLTASRSPRRLDAISVSRIA